MFPGLESTTPQTATDRRSVRRFDMRLPAVVRMAGAADDDLLTEIQNVSARGAFFYLDRPLVEGSQIDITVTLPPHVTLTEPVRVRFNARVVRVDAPLPGSRVGNAVLIEGYEFLRSRTESSYLQNLPTSWEQGN
jgi:hypothetical protein